MKKFILGMLVLMAVSVLVVSVMVGAGAPPPKQCNDNVDNDGDGLIDEDDPGCYDSGIYDPLDDDEYNVPEPPTAIEVLIDIKPGSDTNSVNINDHGVIPVAILGSAELDVTEIDAGSVSLAGMGVKVAGKSNKYLASIDDVNTDGFNDLVVKIQDRDNTLVEGATTATLTGFLLDGVTEITGTDVIRIVPQ